MILSYYILKEKVSKKKITGYGLILMGVIVSYVAAVVLGKFGCCDAISYDAVAKAAVEDGVARAPELL